MSTESTTDPEVQQVWDEFWSPLVAPDGAVDLEQIKRELFDWHTAMDQVSRAYCDITGGRFSKPNTAAGWIVSAHEEAVTDAAERGRLEGQQSLLLDLLKEDAPSVTDDICLARLRQVEARLAGKEPSEPDACGLCGHIHEQDEPHLVEAL